jgi:hypothetical protein
MAATEPRVLLRGGIVASPAAPNASAMLTVGDRVVWVGGEDAASTYVDSADAVVELGGRLVTPGFVDAHAHLGQTGFALESVDLTETVSLAEALTEVESFARSWQGAVVFAHGWDETRWPEQRPPTTAELDRAVGDRAAYLVRIDAHTAVVSSQLLRRAPEIATKEGYADGLVQRDAHHAARDATARLRSVSDRRAALHRALRRAASVGLTSVHELNAPHIAPAADLALLRDLCQEVPLPEVVPYWGGLLGEGLAEPDSVLGFAGDLCVDGSIGSRTACLHGDYADAPTAGYLYLDAEAVRDHVVFCTRACKQAGFHVIGEKGMHAVVEGLRAAAEVVGDQALVAGRHRLEHAEMITDDQIADLARWGVVASVQPSFDAYWGASGGVYEQRLGRERAVAMNPFAALHRAGVVLAFGSDSPVTPFDPWGGVRAAAYHHNPDQRLSPWAAFDAHTRGGHRACGDDESGLLVAGARASYAVWEVSGEVTVSPPDHRAGGWSAETGSAEARPGVPALPDLDPSLPLPTCVRTVVAGTPVFVAEDAL